MGFFDKFKIKKPEEKKDKKPQKEDKAIKPAGKEDARVEEKKEDKSREIKGKSQIAFRVLLKPLITEKGTNLAAQNKYIFSVNPQMNKIEVKKAIRSIYRVDPVKINICNFPGKNVRYGRRQGKTKAWKKAIVTLKAGDKIEVYEGV